MASKSIKTVSSKGTGSAGSSPAHTSKLQASAPPTDSQTLTLEMLHEALQVTQDKIATLINAKTNDTNERIQAVLEEISIWKQQMREDILMVFKSLAGDIELVDEKVEEIKQSTEMLDNKLGETQNRIERAEVDVMMIQYRDMEYALRFRGVKDQKQEDLKEIMSEALAQLLGETEKVVGWQIDKVYRVNSWVARQKHLPRDIVIYFNTRTVRNEILQATFKNKLQVKGQEVMTLKEIPPKMLRARREYAFLVDELKKRQLQYRWEVPAGLVVTYSGERYRLNTIWKARDFYINVLKAGTPKTLEGKRKKEGSGDEREELLTVVQGGALTGQEEPLQIQMVVQDFDLIDITEEPKDQRQTRAATAKRKEELRQQQFQKATQETNKTEAVGGARPKGQMRQDHQKMLDLLQKPRNGN